MDLVEGLMGNQPTGVSFELVIRAVSAPDCHQSSRVLLLGVHSVKTCPTNTHWG